MIVPENERLRNLVTKLQDRVANLETIATDPAERTAREIESVRALPRSNGGAGNSESGPSVSDPLRTFSGAVTKLHLLV